MTDIHCHVLPNMDDGSRSVEESLAMLEAMAAQGVDRVAATPHFYAHENSPEEFLSRRAASMEKLAAAWRPGLPALKLGAEVHYFEGIGRCRELDALKLEGTELLLVEMPFCPWTRRMIQEVLEIHVSRVTVLLAHIERYLRWQNEETWHMLAERGVLNQCNASFFLRWSTKKKALRMLREGKVHLLGSDSHNMDSRPPQLGAALALLGQEERENLEKYGRRLLPDWGDEVR